MDNQPLSRLLQGVLALLGILVLLNALILWHTLRIEGALAPLQAAGPPQPEALRPGVDAPDFVLKDMDGHTVHLDDLRGKSVLLVFASTECGVCQKMFPHLSRFHREHPRQTIVMILKGGEEARKKVVDENKFDFPVLAWDDEVAHAYEIPGTPWFFLIDAEGKVRRSGTANTLESITSFALGREDERR